MDHVLQLQRESAANPSLGNMPAAFESGFLFSGGVNNLERMGQIKEASVYQQSPTNFSEFTQWRMWPTAFNSASCLLIDQLVVTWYSRTVPSVTNHKRVPHAVRLYETHGDANV